MTDAGPVQVAEQPVVVLPSAATMSMDIDSLVQLAERQVELQKRVMTIALKATHDWDWVDQGGKPYLCVSGAEKIAPKFGVSITDVIEERFEREDELGKFYFYRYKGNAAAPHFGRLEGVIGTCSSRDQFFAYVTVWETDPATGAKTKKKVLRPLSEIDEGNIMKAAYSNLVVNAVTRVLGIRNLTWEVVQQAGIDVSQVARVDYGKGKAKGKEGGQDHRASGKGQMSEVKRKLGALILDLVHTQNPAISAEQAKEKARELLEKYSAYPGKDGNQVPGLRSLTDLTEGRAKSTLGRVEKDWELICQEEAAEEDADGEGKEAADGAA
ncbi:MAG: hypothetical protein JXP34_26805 [Planctomycetes bacterium]|nr:hypothetical protein [Planctomycetota bacterium]